ncbi:MAG TPA: hypothetical protein VFC19_46775 [Candidatus Limnocylindrales bacterium]|nr:hypothetical protein [Candidatus Limnocylindrales bacterium]
MSSPGGGSLRTVVVAGLANLAVAAAKAITGLLSGSAAMLSGWNSFSPASSAWPTWWWRRG